MVANPFSSFASAQSASPSIAQIASPQLAVAELFNTDSPASINKPLAKVIAQIEAVATLDGPSGVPQGNTVVAAEVPSIQVASQAGQTASSIQVDGKSITFAHADENIGEDLIINSDQQVYSGLSQAEVYFSVDNISKSSQNVALNLYLPRGNGGLTNIERLNVQQKQVPTFSKTCSTVAIASTTKGLTNCSHLKTGTQTRTFTSGSTLLNTVPFDELSITAQLTVGGKTKKSIHGNVSDKTAQDILQPGEKAYYKATIHFDPQSSGEFYIEAVGDQGGYGQLDPWFGSNWLYRKQIAIVGASGAGTNYQVLLRVGESSGSTSTKQFDLGGHSSIFPTGQNQGGDLVFTGSDGTTQLNFWVEEATGTAPNRIAYVWVKVGDDLSTSKNIYVYYGNAGASNASNGFNTFNLFDNFDDGVIDPQKWTTICATGCNITGGVSSSVSESGGVLQQTDTSVGGSQSRVVATTTAINTSGYATKRRFRDTGSGDGFSTTNHGFGSDITSSSGNGTTSPDLQGIQSLNEFALNTTNVSGIPKIYSPGPSQNIWYRSESQRISSTKVGGAIWDDSMNQLVASTTPFSPTVTDIEYPYLRSGDNWSTATDWTLVRKFVSSEPVFSSIASEESLTGTTGAIQDISYTYDAVGNITAIDDLSGTRAAKRVVFAYDDLHRLTSASTTAASSTSYRQTYSYNLIGDITNKSDVGSYTYAGTGNANPHAATTIAGTTYVYDNNGNLTSAGGQKYTWDYRNRITSAGNGTATTTFAYDFQNQRVRKVLGTATTTYPSKYINKVNATTTDYIYMGDTAIAEVDAGGSTGTGSSTSTSTPALVQSTKASGATTVSFASSVTTGNLVVVGLTVFNQAIASNAVTDNKGNTYTKAAEIINGTDHAAIFYAKNVTGGASFQISLGGTLDGTIAIHEYSGIATSSPFMVATSTKTGTSNKPSSGSAVGTVGNSLYFSVAWSNGSGDTWGASNGYTLRQNETDNATFERLATEDQVITNASTSAAYYTTTTSSSYAAAIAIFKPLVTTTSGSGGGGSATTTRYFHEDHLNSTNVMTDAKGNVLQTLDYYPYGATRISISADGSNEKHQFIGQYSDPETNLSYLNARYYNGTTGQFLSEDPIFLDEPSSQNLNNPQSLNSYAYANDNPITGKDPDGKEVLTLSALTSILLAAAAILTAMAAIQMSATGHSSFGAPLTAVDQTLTTVGHAVTSGVIGVMGMASAITGGAMTNAAPLPNHTGGTAVTTPQYFQQMTSSNILLSNGKTNIVSKPGGYEEAQQDFWAQNPQNVQPRPKGVITGDLLNGDKIIVRPNSTDGRPTLEVQHQSGDVTKTRYGDKL